MFSTGEFSRIARVSKRLLQFYDKEGLLRPAFTDSATGYRRYRANQLRQLNRILALRELGLTLDEIRRSLERESSDEELVRLLRQRRLELQEGVREDLRRLRSIEARLAEGAMPDVVLKAVAECAVVAARVELASSREAWPWIVETAISIQRATGGRASAQTILTMPGEGFETEHFLLQASVPYAGPLLSAEEGLFAATLSAIPRAATVVQTGGPDLLHRSYGAIGEWIEKQGYQVEGTPREMLFVQPDPKNCDELVIEAQFPVGGG